MSVKAAYSIWTFLVLDLLGIHAIKQIHPAMQLVSTTTAGGICDRILYIEPMHKICIENHKGEKKKKIYTSPSLAAYKLMLRKPGVIMVNIKTLKKTFERKLDFPSSRVWVITIGCSEKTAEESNF